MKINCLDHGYVRLVESMGNDLSIVRNARVSYDAEWRAGNDSGSDARLINYLHRHRHSTPFEAVVFTFEVKAPIFVLRQWHRHRTWTYNELSARYRELPTEFYVPEVGMIGMQSKTSKQARDISDMSTEDLRTRKAQIDFYDYLCGAQFEAYRDLLSAGWPRELARMCLPLSTYSHMFASVDLWNLMGFLTLRQHQHAQYEIRVYADALAKLVEPIVPVAMSAFNGNRSSWEVAMQLVENSHLEEKKNDRPESS